ncbi:ABC-type dipeptide/oligopeptide/nickel transport system, permease component [Brachybacterium faecium DSM 4810]|uniref:ABC-type dipeptide/oligopeptide/nickel transport system, permease component n=1 Tax=Brachybacterium faecium (strain ATCC 43885 / DSM 4810 / JCM 11609 / LMG 19847 / NBRC 14762 / NCIMB 9860 / 6-10) TaxID=446465 RepID=C7MFB3_BRAFD|nr:ABC transporter permease [Brachybacterium faecium]ACU84013.1 ABC-type dipeptide/oligopeptide/nickel transport system, permease component [Brachybacterium faecium DSM 4810]
MHLLRKIGFYLVALWAAVTLNFFIPRALPGSPVDAVLAKLALRGPVDPHTREAIEVMLGADNDRSLIQEYFAYLGGLFTGDLGVSVTYFPTPVSAVVGQSLPWTLILVGLATTFTFLLGMVLGTVAGWRRGTWLDSLIPATTILQAVPYFWLALLFIYVLSVNLGVFPISGGYDYTLVRPAFDYPFLSNAVYYGFLPALTIVLSSLGGWLLGMRNMMVSTLSEDYILTAEAKGLSPRRVMIMYAARNAMLPSVSGFAISLGFVVSGSIVVETVFSYPGVGFTMLQAVQNNDYPLMQGMFLIITVSVLAANLVVDLLYGVIDPRTRARG